MSTPTNLPVPNKTKPTEELIVWANTDVNLPKLAGPNKTKPTDDLINKGWDFTEKPAADEFNYILNNLGMHVSYLEENKTYTFSGDVTGTTTSSGTEDVDFNISVNDNSHNHISSNISDATSSTVPDTIVKRDANGNAAANNWVGHLTGNADTADKWKTDRTLSLTGSVSGSSSIDGSTDVEISLSLTAVNNVSILTGTIAHGGTIPLPSGYTESQCKWMVSIKSLGTDGGGSSGTESCSADGTRVVTCQLVGYGITGVANYIIIGVK